MVKAQEQRCTKGLENRPGEWTSLGQRGEASQHPPVGTFLLVTSLCAPMSTPGSSQAAASGQGSVRATESKEKLSPPSDTSSVTDFHLQPVAAEGRDKL